MLDRLKSDNGILAFYDTGEIRGFEIDRHETRAVLLAGLGRRDQACDWLKEYEKRWLLSPASERAKKFVAEFRARIGC